MAWLSQPSSGSPIANRPAGRPSALGDVPAEHRARVLRTSTWKVVYNPESGGYSESGGGKPNPRSETREALFSTMRDKSTRVAALQVLAAPSLSSRGAALRESHIDIGFDRPEQVAGRFQTETKQSYVTQPLPMLQSQAECKAKVRALQKSNIDLAFGVEKTGKDWKSDQVDTMAANCERKFACEGRPGPIDGSSNYKSTVQFGDHEMHDHRPVEGVDERVSESKCQFINPGKPKMAVSYAATRGKELQQHSWDNAMGREKTTTQWITHEKDTMARNAWEKYSAMKPNIDPRLSKELRQSSVFLGKDAVEWPTQDRLVRSTSMPSMPRIGSRVCRP